MNDTSTLSRNHAEHPATLQTPRFWRGRRIVYQRVDVPRWRGGRGYVWHAMVHVWAPGTPLAEDGLPTADPGSELPTVMMFVAAFEALTRLDRASSRHINTSILTARHEELEEQLQELFPASAGRKARAAGGRRRQHHAARSAAHALHVEMGRVGTGDHYAFASGALGRHVDSFRDLTREDRDAVRDAIQEQLILTVY